MRQPPPAAVQEDGNVATEDVEVMASMRDIEAPVPDPSEEPQVQAPL